MKLELRNWLAEHCLQALVDPAAEPRLWALQAFARRADDEGSAVGLSDPACGALLGGESPFESIDGAVRLRAHFGQGLPALRWRCERFLEALSACRARCGEVPPAMMISSTFADRRTARAPSEQEVTWVLCAASALFNADLFFEVHEILEPCWGRAEGALRSFLQGLIQVAGGLHHRDNGNRRGAIALLAEGNGKLRGFAPAAFGVEIAVFTQAIDALVDRLWIDAPSRDVDAPRLVLRDAEP